MKQLDLMQCSSSFQLKAQICPAYGDEGDWLRCSYSGTESSPILQYLFRYQLLTLSFYELRVKSSSRHEMPLK